MSRLPPAEKLPLAVRKDIRDNWENKKEEFEKNISDVLGESWTINIDPKAIWPYGDDNSWAKTSTGDMLGRYISGAESSLKSFIEAFGDDAKAEINNIATAHTITMDFDEAGKFYYCGVEVSPAGELVILFSKGNLGTNIDQALSRDNLAKALNEAPIRNGSLSYSTRTGIRKEYTGQIAPVQQKLNKILGKEIPLDPNFEAVFEKLKAGPHSPNEWEDRVGEYIRLYFQALNEYLEREKFGEDEMLQEGLTEAIENNTIRFRIVDKTVGYYNEAIIEDGVLYLQTTPSNFGTNISQIADKIMDLL
ncbi:Fc.00g002440.m01.CDS01 [Cosmosporella sp. VM-42]